MWANFCIERAICVPNFLRPSLYVFLLTQYPLRKRVNNWRKYDVDSYLLHSVIPSCKQCQLHYVALRIQRPIKQAHGNTDLFFFMFHSNNKITVSIIDAHIWKTTCVYGKVNNMCLVPTPYSGSEQRTNASVFAMCWKVESDNSRRESPVNFIIFAVDYAVVHQWTFEQWHIDEHKRPSSHRIRIVHFILILCVPVYRLFGPLTPNCMYDTHTVQ